MGGTGVELRWSFHEVKEHGRGSLSWRRKVQRQMEGGVIRWHGEGGTATLPKQGREERTRGRW